MDFLTNPLSLFGGGDKKKKPAATPAPATESAIKPWMIYTAVGLVIVIVALLLFRRK